MVNFIPAVGKFSFLIAISIIICSASESPSLRSSFGQYCNKTLRCNSREFLTCVNETCNCLKPDGMTFDPVLNSCVTLAGELCRYTLVSNEDQRSWTEEVKCLTNAKCNSEGICDCEANFNEISNGTCKPKGIHGEVCNTDDHCRSDLHFKCINGICSCNKDISIFSTSQNACVGLGEKKCISSKCVANSLCDTKAKIPNPTYPYYREYDRENPDYNLCKCASNTKVSKEGLCLVPINGKCDSSYPTSNCFPSLKCRDGTCVCPFEDYQYYDEGIKGCVTLVGGPCWTSQNSSSSSLQMVESSLANPSWESTCVDHSSCPAGLPSKCQCDDGFVANKDRKCELGFGQSCSATNSMSCGKLQGLFCINGKCVCKNELQVYIEEVSDCRGLVDSICSETLLCIDGAICIPQKTSKVGEGICICNEGYEVNKQNRSCGKPPREISNIVTPWPIERRVTTTTTTTETTNKMMADAILTDNKLEDAETDVSNEFKDSVNY